MPRIVPAEQVQVGDRIRVLPGEIVPVDGVILSGQTSINQAVMTGESLPVDKSAGDEVSSGTVTADLSSVLSDGKAHLVALTAWDASGNRSRQGWDVADLAGGILNYRGKYIDRSPLPN